MCTLVWTQAGCIEAWLTKARSATMYRHIRHAAGSGRSECIGVSSTVSSNTDDEATVHSGSLGRTFVHCISHDPVLHKSVRAIKLPAMQDTPDARGHHPMRHRSASITRARAINHFFFGVFGVKSPDNVVTSGLSESNLIFGLGHTPAKNRSGVLGPRLCLGTGRRDTNKSLGCKTISGTFRRRLTHT